MNLARATKRAPLWIVALALTLGGTYYACSTGGCDSLFHRAEREMARSDAELHRYCQSLSPGAPWSPSVLPSSFHSEGGDDTWRVLGTGVAVCELKIDAHSTLVSAEFRPD